MKGNNKYSKLTFGFTDAKVFKQHVIMASQNLSFFEQQNIPISNLSRAKTGMQIVVNRNALFYDNIQYGSSVYTLRECS